MSLEYLITALIVVLVPGTGALYTVAVGLGRGRQAAIAAAFGCTLGIIPAIAASVVGLSALLHASALLFQIVKYAGVAYLLYLAWQTLQEKGPLALKEDQSGSAGYLAVIRTGFLINILNPKLTVFFLAFLPQFVDPASTSLTADMLVLASVFMVMTFLVFAVYGSFAAVVGTKVLSSQRAMTMMRRSVAAAFAVFGLRLAMAER